MCSYSRYGYIIINNFLMDGCVFIVDMVIL